MISALVITGLYSSCFIWHTDISLINGVIFFHVCAVYFYSELNESWLCSDVVWFSKSTAGGARQQLHKLTESGFQLTTASALLPGMFLGLKANSFLFFVKQLLRNHFNNYKLSANWAQGDFNLQTNGMWNVLTQWILIKKKKKFVCFHFFNFSFKYNKYKASPEVKGCFFPLSITEFCICKHTLLCPQPLKFWFRRMYCCLIHSRGSFNPPKCQGLTKSQHNCALRNHMQMKLSDRL